MRWMDEMIEQPKASAIARPEPCERLREEIEALGERSLLLREGSLCVHAFRAHEAPALLREKEKGKLRHLAVSRPARATNIGSVVDFAPSCAAAENARARAASSGSAFGGRMCRTWSSA